MFTIKVKKSNTWDPRTEKYMPYSAEVHTKTYGSTGITGLGETAEQARESASAKIEDVVCGSYGLRLVPCESLMGVMWRSPWGYEYRIFEVEEFAQLNRDYSYFGTSSAEPREDQCERSMRKHMASNLWIPGRTERPACLDHRTVSYEDRQEWDRDVKRRNLTARWQALGVPAREALDLAYQDLTPGPDAAEGAAAILAEQNAEQAE